MRACRINSVTSLSIALAPKPISLAVELRAELPEEFGHHQPLPRAVEDRSLENVDPDVETVIAGAAIAHGGTAEQMFADLHVAGPAGATFGKAGNKKTWPLPFPERPIALRVSCCV